jgi:PAS domain S-box-containing protein
VKLLKIPTPPKEFIIYGVLVGAGILVLMEALDGSRLGILLAAVCLPAGCLAAWMLGRAMRDEKDQRERYKLFSDIAEEAILIHDQGVILDTNPALARLLGYEVPEMIGQPVTRFMDPSSGRKTEEYLQKGYPQGSYEVTAQRKDGTHFQLLVHGRDMDYKGHKARFSIGWDLTEWKRAEEAVRKSEDNFRTLIESSPDAVLVHQEGKIIYVNQKCLQLLGYEDKGGLLSKPPLETIHPGDREKIVKRIEQTLRGGENPAIEIRVLRKDGAPVEVESSSIGIRFEGRPATMVLLRDIAARKRAEEALRASEERFRNLLENSREGISLTDREGKVIYVSPSNKKLTGYDGGERVGRGVLDLLHPEDLARAAGEMDRLRKNPGLSVTSQFRLRHKDGRWLTAEVTAVNLLDNPDVGGILINSRDVTKEKEAQEALARKELYFRSLIENSHDVISITGRDGKMTYISPSVKRVLGYEPSERIGQGYLQIMHPDDVERIRSEFGKLLAAQGASWTVEFRLKHKDGTWRHVESTGINLLDDPVVGGIIYNLRDITPSKRAEEALRQSEERFRNLIENSNDVITLTGTDTKTIYVSSSIRKVMGYSPEERVGRSFMELVHPDDQSRVRGLLKEFGYNFGTTLNVGVRAKHKDGTWRDLDVVATNLLNHPVIQGIILNYRDVTDKKLADEALRRSEENFRELIEKSPDAIIVHTLERTVYVNQALLGLLGYERDGELVGRSPEIIVHPEDRKAVKARIQKLGSGKGYNPPAERRFLARDGRTVPVEVVSFAIQFQEGPVIVAIARDLTERKETEKALMRFERLSTIGEMAASLAHEIRNPLASISAAAQILKKKNGALGKEEGKTLDAILAQTERLNRLILDTLHFSKAERPTDTETFPVKEALEGALRLSQVQFGPAHSKVKVVWELPEEEPRLNANPQRVQQVLVNLILNAYQAMAGGGTLTLGLKTGPEWVSIRVADSGPGISEEDLGRIFEPFFTTKKSGSGLGLAICSRIAAENGGRLEVERIKPHGTAFLFTLPLKEGRAA